MNRLIKTACAMLLLAIVGNSHAQNTAISADVHFGTLGAGVEIKRKFNDHFNARLVINQYEFSYDETEDGTEYSGELDWSTYGVIADWHPAGNGFRLSVGLLANDNELRSSSVGGTFTYGTNDIEYAGNANLKVAFDSLAPYASIGWSSQKPRGLSVNFELGAMFQGTPLLSANGSVEDNNGNSCSFSIDDKGNAAVKSGCTDTVGETKFANLKDDLEAGHDEETSDFDDFDVYPVIVFGLQYRF